METSSDDEDFDAFLAEIDAVADVNGPKLIACWSCKNYFNTSKIYYRMDDVCPRCYEIMRRAYYKKYDPENYEAYIKNPGAFIEKTLQDNEEYLGIFKRLTRKDYGLL